MPSASCASAEVQRAPRPRSPQARSEGLRGRSPVATGRPLSGFCRKNRSSLAQLRGIAPESRHGGKLRKMRIISPQLSADLLLSFHDFCGRVRTKSSGNLDESPSRYPASRPIDSSLRSRLLDPPRSNPINEKVRATNSGRDRYEWRKFSLIDHVKPRPPGVGQSSSAAKQTGGSCVPIRSRRWISKETQP